MIASYRELAISMVCPVWCAHLFVCPTLTLTGRGERMRATVRSNVSFDIRASTSKCDGDLFDSIKRGRQARVRGRHEPSSDGMPVSATEGTTDTPPNTPSDRLATASAPPVAAFPMSTPT